MSQTFDVKAEVKHLLNALTEWEVMNGEEDDEDEIRIRMAARKRKIMGVICGNEENRSIVAKRLEPVDPAFAMAFLLAAGR